MAASSSYGDDNVPPTPGLRGQDPVFDASSASEVLPRLHLYAYKGDLEGVMGCLAEGHDVHGTVVMRNQASRLVCGITPLFLAAQKGHLKVVKMLVQGGANPAQPAFIQGSTELCTPAQVAKLNLHFMTASYIRKAVKTRQKEEAVIREEEESQERRAAGADVTQGQQHVVMANLGDLQNWDPTTGAQPHLLNGNILTRLMRNQQIDLDTWRPDAERGPDGVTQMVVSASRPVDPAELETVEIENHAPALDKFLRDANLMQWQPEKESIVNIDGGPGSLAATRRTSFVDHQGLSSAGTSRAVSRAASVGVSPARGLSPGRDASIPVSPSHPVDPGWSRPASVSAAAAAAAAAAASFGTARGLRSPQTSHFSVANTSSRSLGGGEQQARPNAATRAAAAAAAASLTRTPQRAQRVRSNNATRWTAHDSDSEDDDAELQVSGSVPATVPLPTRA